MKHGPLIFLGVFATFAAAWWAIIFVPQLQLGAQQPATIDGSAYPLGRPGAALQGREVYVANGCVQCHGQQVHQDGYTFDVRLTSAGTNAPAVAALLSEIAPSVKGSEVLAAASDKSPATILTNVSVKTAASAQGKLTEAGAAVQAVFIPLGPDIARHWGTRRTVAADYLYDGPVQIGNSRLGPDLSNIGARMPDANWQLLHLYDPRTMVPGSIMPAYRYLFETRKLGRQPSPDALKLTTPFAPPAGYEVVPKPEALELVAYLQSLRVGTGLFEAPLTELAAAPAETATNAPAPGAVAPGK